MTIELGWWLIPALLTIAAWIPTFRCEVSTGGYFPDIGPLIYATGSIIATLLVWMIYFATLAFTS